MNPTKIELPENLIKKLEKETSILNNINGLIQGKNLIVSDDKEMNNKSISLTNSSKNNSNSNNNNIGNLTIVEDSNKKISEEEENKSSNFIFLNLGNTFSFVFGNLFKFSPLFIVELFYILRPFIYFGSIIAFGKNSFIPLLINLAIDIIVLRTKKRPDEKFMQQKIYFHEYAYRYGRLSLYLLREPIFSIITKPFIEKILKTFRFSEKIINFLIRILTYFTKFYYIL